MAQIALCMVYPVAQLLEALRYKLEGRELISDRVIVIFYWGNPSDSTTALGSTQPLTEISKRWTVKQSLHLSVQAPRFSEV